MLTLSNFNPEWLLMVTIGMVTHIENMCISGLCKTRTFPNPNAASIFFCFALCILIANVNWWPLSLKRPHRILINLYQMILTSFIIDFVMRSVYISYIDGLKWSLDMSTDQLMNLHIKPIEPYVSHLKEPETLLIISTLISIGAIFLAIYTTRRIKDLSKFASTIVCTVKNLIKPKSH